MNPATHGTEGSASAPVLYMALELSNKTWRLALSDGARRRQVSVPAADLAMLACAVAKAAYSDEVDKQCTNERRKSLHDGSLTGKRCLATTGQSIHQDVRRDALTAAQEIVVGPTKPRRPAGLGLGVDRRDYPACGAQPIG
jgi:hypothetical protein